MSFGNKDSALEDSIVRVGQDVKSAEDAFVSVYQDLLKLKDETSFKNVTSMRWRPIQHSSIIRYRTKWRGCQYSFQQTVWESRRVAGSAKSRLDEYIEIQIPIMLDSSITLSERKASLEEMISNTKNDEQSARSISQGIQSLHGNVREVLLSVSMLSLSNKSISNTIESLANVLKTNARPIANVKEVLDVLHLDSDGFTLLEKLGVICNVWAAITSALQDIYERLKLQQSSTQVLTFDKRTQLLNKQLMTLRDALQKYQNTVVAHNPTPMPRALLLEDDLSC